MERAKKFIIIITQHIAKMFLMFSFPAEYLPLRASSSYSRNNQNNTSYLISGPCDLQQQKQDVDRQPDQLHLSTSWSCSSHF